MLAPMSIATTPFQCRALRRGGEGGLGERLMATSAGDVSGPKRALLRFEQKGFRLMRGQMG